MTAVTPPAGANPVQLDVAYPETLSRLLIFVKWLLAIPQLIIASVFDNVVQLLTIVAWFAILFTGRYPESMFNFAVGARRWSHNVTAYVMLLRDEYPPFSLESGQYALAFDVAYPGKLNRLLIFVKWLLVIPNAIVFLFFALAALVTSIVAWFAILFTGRYPRGLFNFAVGVLRWSARINAYVDLMTDRYPPFSPNP
jgi:hypothetical protein